MNGHVATDRGQIRTINEDAGGIFYNKAKQMLAIVADGMGGHQAGEVASELAVSYMETKWKESEPFQTPVEAEEWLETTLAEMNKMIYERSLEKEEYKGMGTTVVLSVCTPEFVTIAHIGDSRCYLIHDNLIERLTNDHSLVNELVRTGQITEMDAELHPRKNVLLKAVGTEETVTPDIKSIHWEEKHFLLLCSDGLTNKVSEEEIANLVCDNEDLAKTCQVFIDLANERGGEDNITIAIIENAVNDKVGEPPC